MGPDVINAPALQTAVTSALEGLPPALRGHRAGLRAYLFRAAASHSSVRRAHRRKTDPEWARAKFSMGEIFYRFYEDEHDVLIWDIRLLLSYLEIAAGFAVEPNHPPARKIVALLRGLSHRRSDIETLRREVGELIDQMEACAARAALRAKRHDVLRHPEALETDELKGTLCVSLAQIVRLGRESRNCLAECGNYLERFVSGALDIWGLRAGDRLVAVLSVERETACVSGALGPGNACLDVEDTQRVACFCARAGWTIGTQCRGLLLEFAGPIIVGPLRTTIGKRVLVYAEWQNAVRIDMSVPPARDEFFSLVETKETLTLAFDPERSCVDEILAGPDPRDVINRFGAKRLRKIVSSVAIGEAAPTLVQHRLLALAA